MPIRPTRAHPPARLPIVAALAALAVAAPAFAQTNSPGSQASPDGSAQSPQPIQSSLLNTGDQGTAGSTEPSASNANGNAAAPSQSLPEPKPGDYGAANFNAPSDVQLAQFIATHQPPSDNSSNADNDGNGTAASNSDTTTQTMGATAAANGHNGMPATATGSTPNANNMN
ncbi:hypothetical protein ACS8Y6_10230 [Salinisphaera sp. RV14]|uniref:hypothetical protein n=1 Tax=Salinisphaera sp. RV14 TaxID=3454140 RepID=UPI003F839E49